MAYNLFCRGEFNSIGIDNISFYQLDIFKKDYEDDPKVLTFGANPIIHQWQDDDPQKPIKGSSLTINLINTGKGPNEISLSDFYSNEDDAFLVVLYNYSYGEDMIFKGFIVQDDCSEIMVDYAHEIQLSATDNLGILKDYTFDQAAIKFGPYTTDFGLDIQTVTDGVVNYIKVNETFSREYNKITAGNKIEITGGAYFDGIYTVLDVFPNGSFGFTIQVEESVGGISPSTLCNLTYQVPYDISSYLSVKEILRLCILSTGIELEYLQVISRLKPNGKDRWIDDTYIDCKSYINNNIYYDCYTILEDLMSRFKASLFQAYGFWYIVRIGEYPICNDYTTNTQYVYRYDALNNFDFLVSGLEEKYLNIEQNMAETGVIKSLLRPYNYTKEIFNYNANKNLLFNGDLQQLGNLITSYTSGGNTIYEYEAPGFNYYVANNTQVKFYIRVVIDANNSESERYLVLQPLAVQEDIPISNSIISTGISLLRGDVIIVKYNTRSSTNIADNTTQNSTPFLQQSGSSFSLRLQYYTSTSGVENNGRWLSGGGFLNTYIDTDDTSNWKSISVISDPAPFDGIFYLPLSFINDFDSDSNQTYFNNLSVEIGSLVNTQSNIIGHSHKTICNTNIKNYDESNIKLDDTKSNSTSGTLFLDTEPYGIRDRTLKWTYEGTCENSYENLEFYFGSEHPITLDRVILITTNNIPSGFNINDYPSGTQFTITNSTNGANGTYTIDYIQIVAFVPGLPLLYIATVEPQPIVEALGTGDFEFNGVFSAKPLGQITTFEQMYLRWRTRAKLDINILNIINNAGPTSNQSFGPLHLIKYYGLQDIIFFLGSISLNYRTNSAQCTLYGLVDENEKRSDLEAVSSYEFNYLYENS